MQQAALQRGQSGWLNQRFVRLLHNRRAASWFLLLAVAGLVQFVNLFANLLGLMIVRRIADNQEPPSTRQTAYAFALSVLVGFAVTVYVYRT
jgi:F0F1-type ATP synthase membrane subunit a